MTELIPGRRVRVQVPASSANLGPGFDTLGLAVGLCDLVDVEVLDEGLEIEILGEGSDELPRTETHLVHRAIQAGFRAAGVTAPGLRIICENVIPQARGLGSSAAAVVAGVAAANGLAGFALSDEDIIQIASAFEGHPDNVAASVLGGAVVSWTSRPVDGRTAPQYRAVGLEVHPDIRATAIVPDHHASTVAVRQVLPTDVSHLDARFNVARAALMTVALTTHPEHLWEATRDRLHQTYRAEVLPVTAEWVNRLRNQGLPAFLSGAGPTCMVLHTREIPAQLLDQAREAGHRVMELPVSGPVAVEVVAG